MAEAAPCPPSTGFVTFTLTAPTTGTYPFSIGHTFKQGDLPSGSTLTGLQCTIKNTWPDGSAKIAVVSGGTTLTANTPKTIGCQIGTAPTGSNLTPTDLTAIVTQSIVFSTDTFGSATFTSSDLLSPFLTWVQGPLMSSYIYRKPIGSDAHLVAWMEVRLFTTGEVEVLPWVENGYTMVAGPTVKTATFSFSLQGSTRFSQAITLPHHTRTPLISGTALSHWASGNASIVPEHNKAYLQSAELVPTFDVQTTSLSVGYPILATSYTPLQQGDYKFGPDQLDLMPNSGYGEPIGLLPGWEVKYITCTSGLNAAAYGAVIRNGYSAGRYPIHYRDETTQKPIRFSSYPMMALSNPGSDGSGFKSQGGGTSYTPVILDTTGTKIWDTAHSPSVGYLPYLLTGYFYFVEECQFACVTNFLGMDAGSTQRTGVSGLHKSDYGAWQVRSCAWGIRTLAQSLCVTPDSDQLRDEFLNSMQSNIDYYYNRYVAQANNPLGALIDWDAGPGGYGQAAPWQVDFFTGAIGSTLAMGLPLSGAYTTKLIGVLGYTAKNIIGRLGTSSAPDWWWINAFTYQMAVSPSTVPDWAGGTGPWYTTWRDAYNATYSTPPSWLGSTEGTIAYEFPNPNDMVRGYIGNALPAISYAVRFNVAGALTAYNKIITATNWSSISTAWPTYPVWAQKPASGILPAWLGSASVDSWTQISGTIHMGSAAAVGDTGGSASNSTTRLSFSGITSHSGELLLASTGGHHDSSDNRVTSIDITVDAPAWTLRRAAYGTPVIDVAYYRTTPTVEPTSRHAYNATIYSTTRSRLMLHRSRGVYGNGISTDDSNGFNLSTNTYDAPGTWSAGKSALCRDASDNVWAHESYFQLWKWTASTDTWAQTGSFANQVNGAMTFDSMRSQLFQLGWGDGEGTSSGGSTGMRAYVYNAAGTTQTAITLNSIGGAVAQFASDAPSYATMVYDQDGDRFLFMGSTLTRIYVVIPNGTTTWDLSILSTTGATPPAPSSTFGRICLVRQGLLKGVAYMSSGHENLFFLRTS